MIVWISGPTGAGKSSLANVLAALGYSVVEEELPENQFRAFSLDPIRYCAPLQEEIMRSRFAKWQSMSNAPRLIFDRSIDEDARIFCRMHQECGFLDDQQYKRLQGIATDLQSGMPNPDLIVFMWPNRSALMERVKLAPHPDSIIQSLDRQLSLYTEWLTTRKEDVLRIDNSGCSPRVVQQFLLSSAKYAQCDMAANSQKHT